MNSTIKNKSGETLDDVLNKIKQNLTNSKSENIRNEIETNLSKSDFKLPSFLSDPRKYIDSKIDSTVIDIEKIYEDEDEFKEKTEKYLEELKQKDLEPKISNIDKLYLEGRKTKKGLDEHPFMSKLDCKDRVNYCFTNKELSKMCFNTGNHIHDTYILPCKLRTEMKKLMNYIIYNMDIEPYKDYHYLKKSVEYHIINTLPKFNFSEEEINSLIISARNGEHKYNIFTMSVNQSDISVVPVKDGRGIFIEYLLRLFKINADLFKEIIDKYIDKLIILYKYTEIDAINSGFKFLNTLILGSETVDDLEEYYINLYKEYKRGILDSDSE